MTTQKLPIAIILPHASLDVPPEFEGRLAINKDQIYNEADVYTDLLFDFRDQVTHWLRFPYARALIDVNRPADPAFLKRIGDGIVKDVTSYGSPIFSPGQHPTLSEEEAIIHRYWTSWHEQLVAIAADPDIKLVIDAHSMAARGPQKYDPEEKLRPRACVSNLGDSAGLPNEPHQRLTMAPEQLRFLGEEVGRRFARLDALCEAAEPGPVALNTPYRGGWDLKAHGLDSQQPWVMIEVSRAMYVGRQRSDSLARPPHMVEISALRTALWEAIVALFQHLQPPA